MLTENEKLTKSNGKKPDQFMCKGADHTCHNADCGTCKMYDGMLDRLGAYESTNLTPDDITALQSELQRLRGAEAAREKGCEYTIHIPSEEGYPNVPGRFYQCTCGSSYIPIDHAIEWVHCPDCGRDIKSKETYACSECNYTELDAGSLYCTCGVSKRHYENVDDTAFDGCAHFTPKEAHNARL